jgi:DUF4097 and DUF4098 domain-containing protein YvlB
MRALPVLPLLLAACASRAVTLAHPDLEAEAARTESIDISGAEGLVLDMATHAGAITVEVAEGRPALVADLRMMARTEAEAERLLTGFTLSGRVEKDAFVVRVEGEPAAIGGTDLRMRPTVAFRAHVPPGQRMRAESASGDVEVRGAGGDCTLVTAFGNVTVVGVRAESVRVRAVSGGVRVEDVEARWIDLDAAFGDVHIEGVRGDVEVDADSGNVTLKGFTLGSCRLQTGFGDIRASGVFADLSARTSSGRVVVLAERGSTVARPWSLQSAFGDVEVKLPTDFDCDLYAETAFGSVTTDVTVRAQGRVSDQRIRGEIGDGGILLTLRTSSGDIRIRGQ